jgi:hypothetical protein
MASLGVRRRVQGKRRFVLRIAAPVRARGVLFLDVRGVEQEDPGEVGGSRRAEDRPAKSVSDEQRQIARVIEVGVAQDDGIDAGRIEPWRRPVPTPQLLQALKEAAVEQHPTATRPEEEPGAGHGSRRAEELKRRLARHGLRAVDQELQQIASGDHTGQPAIVHDGDGVEVSVEQNADHLTDRGIGCDRMR